MINQGHILSRPILLSRVLATTVCNGCWKFLFLAVLLLEVSDLSGRGFATRQFLHLLHAGDLASRKVLHLSGRMGIFSIDGYALAVMII